MDRSVANIRSAAQADWLGPKLGERLALCYICQMNWVNFRSYSCGDSIVNIVVAITVTFVIIVVTGSAACDGTDMGSQRPTDLRSSWL